MAFRTRDLFFAAAIAIIASGYASAQLTVINVPSTDTLQEKKFYIEADFLTKPTSWAKGGFQSYGYRTVYGVNRKTEVGVSFFYTRNGSTSPKELQLTIKRKVFESEKYGIGATAGAVAYIPLNRSAGTRTPILTYGNMSKTIGQLNGLRITGGLYKVLNGGRDFGKDKGVIVAVEQPLVKRFSFYADWYSGENRIGYAAAGINYAITKNQFILPTWNIANGNGAANYFGVFYGVTF